MDFLSVFGHGITLDPLNAGIIWGLYKLIEKINGLDRRLVKLETTSKLYVERKN